MSCCNRLSTLLTALSSVSFLTCCNNRFNTDTEVIDAGPLLSIISLYGFSLRLVFISLALALMNLWILPLVPCVILAVYFKVYRKYRPAVREFERSRLSALDPISSSLSEVESGKLLSLIPAFWCDDPSSFCSFILPSGDVIIRAMGAQRYYHELHADFCSNLMKTLFIKVG